MLKSLEELVKIIRESKNIGSEKSYTSKLLNNKKMCIDKVNEEVGELIEYSTLYVELVFLQENRPKQITIIK